MRQLFISLILASLCTPTLADTKALGAIIIDDIGYNTISARRIASLPWPLTCAVLPEAGASVPAAGILAEAGKELMLHLPMEGRSGEARERSVLSADMGQRQFRQELLRQLDRFPSVVGVNNHQGSVLTTQRQPMDWLMQELSNIEQFYVVDSRTASDSLLQSTARRFGLPATTRDVFLDHHRNEAYIARQMLRFVEIAKKHGTAIAIGHPYPETLRVLEAALPQLESEGIRLVPVSELIQYKMAQNSHQKEREPTTVASREPDSAVQ